MEKYSDLTGKTIFDYADKNVIENMGIFDTKEEYLKETKKKIRVTDLLNLSAELKDEELRKAITLQYPKIVAEYYAMFNE